MDILLSGLTVLLRPRGDGGRGSPLTPPGLGGQPDVVQRVGVEPVQGVLVAHRQAAVVLVLEK